MKWRLDPGQIEVVDDEVAEILRHKTPAQRVRMISEAHRMARLIVEGGLRTRNPDWSNDRIKAEVARRMTRGAS